MKRSRILPITFVIAAALLYESRIIWKDALFLLLLTPLSVVQALAPNYALPDVQAIRDAFHKGESNLATKRMAGLRSVLDTMEALRFYFVEPDFGTFISNANVTWFNIPSKHEPGVTFKAMLVPSPSALKQTKRPLIVYFHGGGMALGHPNIVEAYRLAFDCNVDVLSVDYRLSPEYPFPAGVNDAFDALLWSIESSEVLGIEKEKIAVAGTSGGGLIASSVSLRARNEGIRPSIYVQYLAIPVLRYGGQGTASWKEFFHIPGLNAMTMGWFWEAYSTPLGCYHPLCSPMFETNHSGLPPTIILTAVADVLRDDGLIYESLLKDANVLVYSFSSPNSHIGVGLFQTPETKSSLLFLEKMLHEKKV